MRRKNKQRPLTTQSRAHIRVHVLRPRPLTSSRAVARNVTRQILTVRKRPLNRARRTQFVNKVHTPFHSRVLTPINSPTHCDQSFSRLLSWRADQKSTSGGRKRAPRSQREKAASAAKHFKNCK